MTKEEIEEQKTVARLSVLSLVNEMIIESTPLTAWDDLKKLAKLLTRAIEREVVFLGASTGYREFLSGTK